MSSARIGRIPGERLRVDARRWERYVEVAADIPWGVIAFAAVLGLRLFGALGADDITGFGTAAGLLGVGHGIHAGAKHLAKRKTE